MIRGTTPTLESILPFDTSLIAEMYVTIAQGEKTVLEKTLSDCSCSGTSVSLALTQEDTLRLQQQPHSRAEMQIRVRTTAATNITLGISGGKLTGLPSGLSGGTLLVTRGI